MADYAFSGSGRAVAFGFTRFTLDANLARCRDLVPQKLGRLVPQVMQ